MSVTLKKGDVVVHRETPKRIYTGKMLFYVEAVARGLGVEVSQVTSNFSMSAKHWFPANELLVVGHVSEKLQRSMHRGRSRACSFSPADMPKFDSAKAKAIELGWALNSVWCS